jgi:hypothetical protein
MDTHPIPQQISSYQFRLVGDMTLKQFFQLAGGVLVSLLFYASNLPGIVKWPLIIFFALLGVALAFLPFEDRPLEKWILAFIRAIYSPNLYYWQKIQKLPIFFQDEAIVPQDKIIAPQGEAKLNEYLASTKQQGGILEKLDAAEKNFLSKMGTLFGPGSNSSGHTVFQPQPVPIIQPQQPLTVPITTPTHVTSRIRVEENVAPNVPFNVSSSPVNPLFKAQEIGTQNEAQFSLDAAPPSPPSVPNTISGQVLDDSGKIIEGAILEIRDVAGRPVRALRSNRLGHFIVVTPLSNGRYEICTEKDGFSFDSVFFETQGVLIPPIAVKGKSQIIPITSELPVANSPIQPVSPN